MPENIPNASRRPGSLGLIEWWRQQWARVIGRPPERKKSETVVPLREPIRQVIRAGKWPESSFLLNGQAGNMNVTDGQAKAPPHTNNAA